jgi:predicted enzyme related to lactoylglutathione lyase
MTASIGTVIYPVGDIAQAKALFTALLGIDPVADTPYYVGYETGNQHIGLNPNGAAQGMTGPVAYYHVDDINKTMKTLVAAGATEQNPVNDVGGGRLIATLTDANGNVIGLLQDK